MRFLLFIDSLGSGGAQKQLVTLARALASSPHDVHVATYNNSEAFFESLLIERRIPIHVLRKPSRFSPLPIYDLIRVIRNNQFDIVISFLSTPNIYAKLARLVCRNTAVICSERSSWRALRPGLMTFLSINSHIFADAITTNSEDNAMWLRKHRSLKKKVHVIWNGYELPPYHLNSPQSDHLHFLGIGRISPEKNLLGLMKAASIAIDDGFTNFRIAWAGRLEKGTAAEKYQAELNRFLSANPLVQLRWRWLGEVKEMQSEISKCDAVIAPSLYEGMSNALCEGMCAGKPILASDIADNQILVSPPERGLIFQSESPQDIAAALKYFLSVPRETRQKMSSDALYFSRVYLEAEKMANAYILLAENLKSKRQHG
jgi:glycosyltransferase involved in cell wall biosynthesis